MSCQDKWEKNTTQWEAHGWESHWSQCQAHNDILFWNHNPERCLDLSGRKLELYLLLQGQLEDFSLLCTIFFLSPLSPQLLGNMILIVLATQFSREFTPQMQAAWQKLTAAVANALAYKYHWVACLTVGTYQRGPCVRRVHLLGTNGQCLDSRINFYMIKMK